jgi:predicted metal-dependent HD superfamily phosphohydrolase
MNLQTIANLTTLYTEPHRHYHTLNHIHECLAEYERYREATGDNQHHAVVETSIWWHDAVYNPYSKQNEKKSAELFSHSLDQKEARWGHNDIIKEIILLTAEHTTDQTFWGWDEGYANAAKLVLDLDLHSLAAVGDKFHKNGDDIRKEFWFVDDAAFYKGRVGFLETLMKRSRLYYTEYFYNKYEATARYNITTSIAMARIKLKRLEIATVPPETVKKS